MNKQVEKSHYDFEEYIDKNRWNSMWHQLDEVSNFKPDNILEVGPGPGVFKATANIVWEGKVKTLDIDPELNPDYVESVFDMPFDNNSFDVVCAFQMLEHLPYEKSLLAFKEMSRVAKKGVVISLPDARRSASIIFKLPKVGCVGLAIPLKPWLSKHIFDGEHYWEVNKKGYSLKKVIKGFSKFDWALKRTFRVLENPYHRFFVFLPQNES